MDVNVMDEFMYNTLVRYFKTLAHTGYKSYDVVFKMLIIDFIYEITNTELRYYITNKDIKMMQDLLYQFFGSTCEISFPTNNRPCCICVCCNEENSTPPPIITPTTTSTKPPIKTVFYYYGAGKAPSDIKTGNKTENKIFTFQPGRIKDFWVAVPKGTSVTNLTSNPDTIPDINLLEKLRKTSTEVEVDNIKYDVITFTSMGNFIFPVRVTLS